MDALVNAIAPISDYIHAHGPSAIAQLTAILEAIKTGTGYIGAVAVLIGKAPALIEIITQLIALLSSGAGVAEIAAQLSALAATLGVSVEAVIHLLQAIGAVLVIF